MALSSSSLLTVILSPTSSSSENNRCRLKIGLQKFTIKKLKIKSFYYQKQDSKLKVCLRYISIDLLLKNFLVLHWHACITTYEPVQPFSSSGTFRKEANPLSAVCWSQIVKHCKLQHNI